MLKFIFFHQIQKQSYSKWIRKIICTFKCYYKKYLVQLMLEQIEEKEKFNPIKIKQAIVSSRGVDNNDFKDDN